MIGARLKYALRSRATSSTMLGAATAAVIVMAVTATGVPVNHEAANDGGVWLTNNNPGQGFRGTFAEFNAPIKQIANSFGAPGSVPQQSYDLDVLQKETTVLAVDRGEGALYPVDSQTGDTDPSAGVTFPTGSQIALGGGVAAILQPAAGGAQSRLWVANVGTGATPSVTGLNTTSAKAALKVTGGEAVAVDQAGDVYVASRTEMTTLPYLKGAFKSPVITRFAQPLSSVSLTTVGTDPVILDTNERVVHFPLSNLATTIPAGLGSGPDLVLQQSGPADSSVLLATDTTLISVPLSGQMPTIEATVPAGKPAGPVRLDGCAYGAWADTPAQAAQVCESGLRFEGPLPGQATLVQPVFRTNHNQVVLNDVANGNAWMVAGRPEQVLTHQDWIKVLQGTNPNKNNQNNSTANPQHDKRQPKLNNPTLHARTGKDSILHILDHDTDPGGSILSIVNVSPASGPGFDVRIAPDTQTVVLSLHTGVTGPITFSYQVVDGFGLTATGPVTVVPVADNDNKAPIPPSTAPPVRPVVSGGTVQLQVLGDWRDPDSDPLSIDDVTPAQGMGQVSWTSDGLITYSAPTVSSDTPVILTYRVTDGRSGPVSATLQFRILGRGDTKAFPPDGVPDAARIVVDRPTVVSPLENDLFGADPNDRGARLALAGPVASATGLTVQTNVRTGQLTLAASRPGTYSLTYQASYGSALSDATQILIQVVAPAGTVQPPVTSPESVLLHGQNPATVDVLAGDYDPAGGLLTVVGVTAPSGLQATVVEGEFLRIAAVSSVTTANLVVNYKVTNGRTDPVAGQVSVLETPALLAEAPVAPDTFATVRAGDEVDVPVLQSASDPDGESVHLLPGGAPKAVEITQTDPGTPYATGLGSASVSGAYLRYAAPSDTGITSPESITAAYKIQSDEGRATTGHTYITVVPDTQATTTPPEPTEVDARVTAGGTITIPIPTTGVDPDGDSVTLAGITSAPQLGRVLSYNANSITYQAFPFSPRSGAFSGGTDDFSYAVVGPSGLQAQALIRVGVSPPAQPQPPVAVDHFVTAAPGNQVSVNLLGGDFVTPGDQVTVEDLGKTNARIPAGVSLVGSQRNILQATAPSGAAPVKVAFGITDRTTAPSVAHVTVRSQPGYVTPPVATDYYPAAPAATAKSITVNVLANDTDPGGQPGDLVVDSSPVNRVQVAGGQLVIPVGPSPRAVPYTIRSTATNAMAVGVVHVLGTAMGPQLKTNSLIHVPKNGSISVNIADYVTEAGHSIRLTTGDQTSASPAGGLGERVTGNTGITLTGLSDYVGPGSLTIQVIDSPTLSTPGAKTATMSIPVVVGNPTPVVRCPSAPIDIVQGGGTKDVPIAGVCQVWTPDGSSPDTVAFSKDWKQVAPGVGLGWQSGQSGHVLTLLADSSTKAGAVGVVSIGVPGGAPSSGSTLSVQVVAAGPPSAAPASAAPVMTGHTATADMSQYITSPLFRPYIYVLSVHQTTGSPVAASVRGSVVSISPPTGVHGTLTYAVEVSDQGPSPTSTERVVYDNLTVQVLDRPGPPTGLQGVPGNRQVALSWTAAPDNGAPVDHYIVSMGGANRPTAGTSYTWTGLTNGQSYSFTVTAVNQVDPGAPSAAATFSPRAAPDPPTGVTATSVNAPDGTVNVSWSPANPEGQPITGYTVYVSPDPGGPASRQAGPNQLSLPWSGLKDSVGPYTFTVIAHNAVGPSPTSAPSNSAYAHGVPTAPATPTAAGQVSPDQSTTSVVVSWPAVGNCNDAQPCASYVVTELKNGSPVTTAPPSGGSSGGGTLRADFGPITNDGSSYTYTLEAVNREGQTSSASGATSPPVPAVGAPSMVTDLTSSPGNTEITLTFTLPASHASTISQVNYTVTGGSSPINGAWSSPGSSGQRVSETIGGLVNGTTYSVTVSACNDAGKCGPDSNAVSGPSTDPYGPPNPPSVSAQPSSGSIVYSWSGGGQNGRPVASYTLCIDSSCSNKGASPGSTSVNYGCSATVHSVYAYVTDTVNQNSANSQTATATTEITGCPTPTAPSLAAGASGNNIVWSWSGGGGTQLATTWTLCIDGNCHNVGPSPGSENDGYGCGQTHSAYVYLTDQVGRQSPHSNLASATTAGCPPPPTVTVSWGGRAPSSDCRGDTSCTYLNVSWANLSGGNHTLTPYFDGAYWGYPSATVSGSSGSYNGHYWAGYCRSSHAVTANVGGTGSNTINTTDHGC